MQTLSVKLNQDVEPTHIGRQASLSDVGQLVPPNTIITVEGRPLIVFGKFKHEHKGIKAMLPRIKYTSKDRLTRRNNEYATQDASDTQFGYKPMRPVFNLPASACKFNAEYPGYYQGLVGLGQELSTLYAQIYPLKFNEQCLKASAIRDHWKLPETFFTQGIVNDTANLDYHYDRGNITGCWSCMAVFRRQVEGGQLVVPAIDAALDIQDETYVLFDGQALLHGVAPIIKTGPYGRRFSIVYYAIEAMKQCGSYEDELKRIRQTDMNKHAKKRKAKP